MASVASMVAEALPVARRFEGFRARPYLCPAAVPSIGYGATRYPDGRKVTLQDPPIPADTAEAMLAHDMDAFVRAAVALSPNLSRLPPAVGAAIGDFCFNLGVTRYKASTLRRCIAIGDWQAAAAELRKWVNGGGRRLPGLVRRRAVEAAMILDAMKSPQLNLEAEVRRIVASSADVVGDLRKLLA